LREVGDVVDRFGGASLRIEAVLLALGVLDAATGLLRGVVRDAGAAAALLRRAEALGLSKVDASLDGSPRIEGRAEATGRRAARAAFGVPGAPAAPARRREAAEIDGAPGRAVGVAAEGAEAPVR
jgi:hypothetical protein